MDNEFELILNYFPTLSEVKKSKLIRLKSLFLEWNSKINLISRKDEEHFYERHVLHSLSIGYYIDFVSGSKIMDVGTGGGFPGIPLAILFPEVEFYLIDSIGKKIMVVKDLVEKMELTNVRAEQIRAEDVNGSFDFIVSRAVTDLSEYMKWVKGKINTNDQNEIKNGVLYLKGGDLAEEFKHVKQYVVAWDLSEVFKEEFFATKKLVYVSR